MLGVGPVHEAVDDEGWLVRGEELGEPGRSPRAADELREEVVFLHPAAARQAPAQRRDCLDPLAQLELGLEQLVSRDAVLVTFVRKANAVWGLRHGGPPMRGYLARL